MVWTKEEEVGPFRQLQGFKRSRGDVEKRAAGAFTPILTDDTEKSSDI